MFKPSKREAYVTENDQALQKLRNNFVAEMPKSFLLNKTIQDEEIYNRRISHKPITGVNLYRKDKKIN